MTTDTRLSLPPLARDHTAAEIGIDHIERAAPDSDTPKKTVRLTFPLSSEAPVERFFGTEILSHQDGAIRLGRVRTGAAPLLFNHNWDDPVGMIEDGATVDGRLIVSAKLFDTERAREVLRMIEGGLRNVSVGYEIHQIEENQRGEYRAIDWTPLEASICTVPADPSVGIGRANDKDHLKTVRVIRTHSTAPAEQQETAMSENTPSAGETVEPKTTTTDTREQPAATPATITREARQNPEQIEQARIKSIEDFAKRNKIDAKHTENWIRSGADFNQIGEDFLKILEARSQAYTQPADIGLSKKEVRDYSLLRAMRAAVKNDWAKAGLELEASKATMERAKRDPIGGAGSFFVPAEIQRRDLLATSTGSQLVDEANLIGSFIELLRNESAVLGLNATRLTGLTGNVKIPRQTGATTAYWLAGEGTTITESQPSFGQIILQPKNVATLVEVSHQMMQQSSIDVENLITRDMARSIALAVDLAALRGDGSDGQPQGIIGTTGVGTFDTDGTSTYADVLSAQTDLMAANALQAGCAYLADPLAAALLMGRTRFASTDTPLWDGSLMQGTMAGFPARSSNQMTANTMLFGWWSQLIIAEWGVLELAVDDKYNFAQGLAALRAWYTVDVGVRHAAAFTYDATVA